MIMGSPLASHCAFGTLQGLPKTCFGEGDEMFNSPVFLPAPRLHAVVGERPETIRTLPQAIAMACPPMLQF